MLVKYSPSGVFKWPTKEAVFDAVRRWAAGEQRAELQRVGVFGSYARGNWGVGSDADIVLIISGTDKPFIARSADWYPTGVPVDVDVLVYTPGEWAEVGGRAMFDPIVWLWPDTPERL